MVGKWDLYWPNEMFKANTTLEHPLLKFPLKAAECCHDKPVMDKFRCFPLTEKVEYSTGVSTTKPSQNALEHSVDLFEIKLAPRMLENLREYATVKSAAEGPGKHPLPSAAEQLGIIKRLAGWFSTFQDYDSGVREVASEAQIQLNVYSQIITPLNLLLKLRYKSNLEASWKQGTEKMKRMMSNVFSSTKGGDSDFIFIPGAVCEIKTFWAVNEKIFNAILADPTFINDNGQVLGFGDDARSKLVVQIWGQLKRHGCRWGFVTNGKSAFVFCKPSEHKLVVSEQIDWESEDLHLTLLGLSCVVVDGKYSSNPKEALAKQNSLIGEICGNPLSPFANNDYMAKGSLRKHRDEFEAVMKADKAKWAAAKRRAVPKKPDDVSGTYSGSGKVVQNLPPRERPFRSGKDKQYDETSE